MGFISRHRLGKKSFLLKKTDPTFSTPFLFGRGYFAGSGKIALGAILPDPVK